MMNNNSTSNWEWCATTLDDFHTVYYPIHGYVSLFVCFFGSIANSLNIAVLTRRDMRSPTNAILTGLAISDLLVMLDYIPYAINEYIYFSLHYSKEAQRSYAWAVIIYFHAFFSQVLHTISIFLTVTLAVWRYIAIAHPQKNRAWCNMRNTLVAIASAYLISPLLCVLTFFMIKIQPHTELHDPSGNKVLENVTFPEGGGGARNVTLYTVAYSDYIKEYQWIWPTNLWIFSVIIKIIPSIALTVLSLRLVGALLEAKRRRKHLMGNSNGMRPIISKDITANEKKGKEKHKSRQLDKERQTDRTTRMLLAVLLLFLITEFPQGILGLLSASSQSFYHKCSLKFGEIADVLALLNSAINFILYCTMSRQFRVTFKLLFWPRCLNRWLPVSQDEMNGCEMREANGHTTTVTNV